MLEASQRVNTHAEYPMIPSSRRVGEIPDPDIREPEPEKSANGSTAALAGFNGGA